ncbi:Mitochondrial_protein_81 [Leishmania infantum]|uniref:Mitochondrial_protein_81 n=2 Tax=Leishmania infantum TaxID=5671 RepID=A0A6L0WHN3_LEIIN|nr:Mitochondrial_protein_81 [Leishmania infantum]SUZ38663.1 Mitochondrial_protein_81 [Leishmania infantum]
MLPIRRSSRPSLTSLPVCGRWRHGVHPVRSAFVHTAVLRQASTPSTRPSGTANGGFGSSGVRDGSAPAPPSRGDGAAVAPQPPSPQGVSPELCFYETFILSDVDVHLTLLEEAHYKHGVWLNVPPQLAPSVPNVGPPAVPEPIYPSAQRERLAAMTAAMTAVQNKRGRGASGGGCATDAELIVEPSCLAYRPTHDPPPFSTTGTRSLRIPEQRRAAAEAAAPSTSDAVSRVSPPAPSSVTASAAEASFAEGTTTTTTRSMHAEVQTVAIRMPVVPSMLYHCSACSRPFRRRQAAEEHVQQRHESRGNCSGASAAAVVMEGPGPGEIIGYEEKAVAVATTKTAAAARVTSPLPMKAAAKAKGMEASAEVATTKGVAGASSAVKPSAFYLAANYRATPRVDLPEDDLIDELLDVVWDDVALARDDIAKPSDLPTTRADLPQHPKRSYDSCQGRFFIPSVLIVEGVADNRAQLEAAAERAVVRATPDGAAPGIKRRPSSAMSVFLPSTMAPRLLPTQRRNADGTLGAGGADADAAGGGIGGGALGAAPTAQELSVAELSRHYPNPFGDSPNAVLMESEKEPINPFVDLEGQAAAVAATAHSGAADGSTADDAVSSPATKEMEWLSRWAARPYACPLCQRRALPDLMKIMAPLLPPSLVAGSEATASTASTAVVYGDGQGASPHLGSGTKRAASTAAGETTAATAGASTSRPARCVPPSGSLEDQPLVADVEAWSWYADRVPRFRLLDSLEDHLQSKHAGYCGGNDEAAAALDGDDGCTGRDGDDSLSEADWQLLYRVARHQQLLARAELLAVQQAYRVMYPKRHSTSAESFSPIKSDGADLPNHVFGDAGKDGAENAAIRDEASGATGGASMGGSPTSGPAIGATTADGTDAPQVHVRSAVNTVLIGTVRDVQEGFLGATRILQYVLAVRNTSAESSGCASADAMGSHVDASNGEEEGAGVDEDLIVVRCVGDLVPVALLKQQVRLGSTIFVAGSLRLNRNVDTVSRRSHAYPYVQVVPPLGCVRVLEA